MEPANITEEEPIVNPEDQFNQKKEPRWINKQRTLVVASRGISDRQRHLMLDIINLMPHSKKECKLEKKDIPNQITELCYIHSCCNFLFFEARKKVDLYLYAGRFPNGPTFKFHVENIHTTQELKQTGNCLKGSRPILSFDASFSQVPYLKLCREVFTHIFNVPKYHPKSKPCVDHAYSFIFTDDRIWFRNYQIFQETQNKVYDIQELHEIGPRFVLHLINVLGGCFAGNMLYKNSKYISPIQQKSIKKDERVKQQLQKQKNRKKANELKNMKVEEDVIDDEDLYNEQEENDEVILHKSKKQQKLERKELQNKQIDEKDEEKEEGDEQDNKKEENDDDDDFEDVEESKEEN